MAIERYSARYQDARGIEHTSIANDGETLRVLIRGVEWTGRDFDALAAAPAAPPAQLALFTLADDCLCACELAFEIPLVVVDGGGGTPATLSVELRLGRPRPDGGLDDEQVQLTLASAHGRFAGAGTSGWFEDELLDIGRQLPPGVHLRACITCLYSDYSPYGHGLFGSMMCFRNLKSEYLQVHTKVDFWSVHDRAERRVQETYHCPEFERRRPGTGYRG